VLIKILHMASGLAVVLLFALRASLLWRDRPLSPGLARFFKIVPHIFYTTLVVFGLILLMRLPGVYPHWLIAKLVLFAVAVSASLKAFRATTPRPQARAGVVIAALAYVLILGLIGVKPGGVYGQVQPVITPVTTPQS
jgi:uncharacterized membrane protein SirB2